MMALEYASAKFGIFEWSTSEKKEQKSDEAYTHNSYFLGLFCEKNIEKSGFNNNFRNW